MFRNNFTFRLGMFLLCLALVAEYNMLIMLRWPAHCQMLALQMAFLKATSELFFWAPLPWLLICLLAEMRSRRHYKQTTGMDFTTKA